MDSVSFLPQGSVVIDIRAYEEQEHMPLTLTNIDVLNIPFFKLANQLSHLDREQFYYLYCAKGVMSQLQALLLHEQGYKNVHVYRP